jgi:hypothetical protein
LFGDSLDEESEVSDLELKMNKKKEYHNRRW